MKKYTAKTDSVSQARVFVMPKFQSSVEVEVYVDEKEKTHLVVDGEGRPPPPAKKKAEPKKKGESKK